MKIENNNPCDIEKKSMAIIEQELQNYDISRFSSVEKQILKRVIHTTADFDYVQNLCFSENAVSKALSVLKEKNAVIVTDTKMALSGISRPALAKLNAEIYCFVSDSDVIEQAKNRNVTRAVVSVEKAVRLFKDRNVIFVVGNAPTFLIRLYELMEEKQIIPSLVIGVPVGFVNVVQSKALILCANTDYIIAKGRKGGSTVAVSICNALLYQLYDRNE